MYRYITALIISLLSFYVIRGFLNKKVIEPDSLTVQLTTTVFENDVFYVYYFNQGQKRWSDDYSVFKRIKGSKKEQEITFVLPLNKPIQRIRIDIGANKEQEPISIKSIILKSKGGQKIFYGNYKDFFKLNAYTIYKDGLFIPKIVSGRYDPFLVSNEQVNATLEQLQKTTPMFNTTVSTLLAFIFSLAIFTCLALSKIKSAPDYLIVTFILMITIPVLTGTFGIEFSKTNLEKRQLAKMPKISFTEEFPKEFEAYYNDNFGLRNSIIQLSSKIKINVFKSSPKPELVQFGKEEYLFYNSLNDEIFNSYTNKNLLTELDLKTYYATFNKRREKLKEKGITYIVGFWPNKHSIYPEMLPLSMKSQIQGNISLADQITDYFKKNNMHFFDVRNSMIRAKPQGLLYRKFDTHWNSDGAFIAYNSFCKQTSNVLRLNPFDKDNFHIVYNKEYNGDLTEQIGVERIAGYSDLVPQYTFKDKDLSYKEISSKGYPKRSVITRNPSAPKSQRLLVFRDSFTSQLIQFLSLHFNEVIYLNGKYDQQLIEKFEPDVVLSCRVERYMLSM